MTKSILPAVALALAAMGPAACVAESDPGADAEAAARAEVTVNNAKLMLPAVAGNPGAVYFDLANTGTRDMMISGAKVVGAANTEMHITEPTGMQRILQVMIKAGETANFKEGGNHLMAMELADTIKPGDTAEVTLHFVGGDEIHFPATVHAAGDR